MTGTTRPLRLAMMVFVGASTMVTQTAWGESLFDMEGLLPKTTTKATSTSLQLGHYRMLQNNETEIPQSTCGSDGSRVTCTVQRTLLGNNTPNRTVDVTLTIQCDVETPKNRNEDDFDFRTGSNCDCTVIVTDQNGGTKDCQCSVCTAGFGESPFAIDCSSGQPDDDEEIIIIDGCSSFDCGLKCNGTCTRSCEISGQEEDCVELCPDVPSPPAVVDEDDNSTTSIMLEFNATTESCNTIDGTNKFVCYRNSQVIASDGTFSQLQAAVECDFDANSALEYRQAHNCTCSVAVTAGGDAGSPQNCECSVCPQGFGENPIAVSCRNNYAAVSECSHIDCNSSCNGTCMFGFEYAGSDCPLTPPPAVPPGNNNDNSTRDDDCYEQLTSDTATDGSKEGFLLADLMFNVQAKSKPVEILSIEINVDLAGGNNSTSVEVFTTKEGYLTTFKNRSAWVQVANTNGVQSTDGSRLAIPPGDFQNIVLSAGERVSVYLSVKEPWIATKMQDSVGLGEVAFEDSTFSFFAGVALSSQFGETFNITRAPQFSGKLIYRPVCTGAIELDFNTTRETCSVIEDRLVCSRTTRMTAPDDTFSDVDVVVDCDPPNSTSVLDFRTAHNCECMVEVIGHDGRERICECSVCPENFGANSIAVSCGDDFVVGECFSIDCNSDCNGSCFFGFDDTTCADPSTNTSNPTSPTISPDSNASETVAPTASPTTPPAGTEQTYAFTNFKLRLVGAKHELTPESKAAWESATESTYHSIFRLGTERLRRRLQELKFSAFDTEVNAIAEEFDALGNNIIYDQSVTFTSLAGFVAEDKARELLLSIFSNEESKREYVFLLGQSHRDFETVTDVVFDPGSVQSNEKNGIDFTIFVVLCCVAFVVCCCCGAVATAFIFGKKRGSNNDQDMENDGGYDVDKDEVPEGPTDSNAGGQEKFNSSENSNGDQQKFDVSESSAQSDFVDERDDRAVPFGEGDSSDDFAPTPSNDLMFDNVNMAPPPTIDDIREAGDHDYFDRDGVMS